MGKLSLEGETLGEAGEMENGEGPWGYSSSEEEEEPAEHLVLQRSMGAIVVGLYPYCLVKIGGDG